MAFINGRGMTVTTEYKGDVPSATSRSLIEAAWDAVTALERDTYTPLMRSIAATKLREAIASTRSEIAPSTGQSERELFDAWLAATYDSDAEFDEARNCYKEFAVHMAWQAFRGARSLPSSMALQPNAEGLLPCPFCGSGEVHMNQNKSSEDESDWPYYVTHHCEGDVLMQCNSWTRSPNTRERAAEAWNRRVCAVSATALKWPSFQEWVDKEGGRCSDGSEHSYRRAHLESSEFARSAWDASRATADDGAEKP